MNNSIGSAKGSRMVQHLPYMPNLADKKRPVYGPFEVAGDSVGQHVSEQFEPRTRRQQRMLQDLIYHSVSCFPGKVSYERKRAGVDETRAVSSSPED